MISPDIAGLDDFLDYDLDIISVGLNPSLLSAKQGFYFANPRNRFWKALNASDMLQESLTPCLESQRVLLDKYKMGFTDVVKRPTSMGSDLNASDYRIGVPELNKKLLLYQPRILWFHGKVAYEKYLKIMGDYCGSTQWGEQKNVISSGRVFVTPNPSPANAAYSLEVLIDWYRKLAEFRDNII